MPTENGAICLKFYPRTRVSVILCCAPLLLSVVVLCDCGYGCAVLLIAMPDELAVLCCCVRNDLLTVRRLLLAIRCRRLAAVLCCCSVICVHSLVG
jgi:hypothetical protein